MVVWLKIRISETGKRENFATGGRVMMEGQEYLHGSEQLSSSPFSQENVCCLHHSDVFFHGVFVISTRTRCELQIPFRTRAER